MITSKLIDVKTTVEYPCLKKHFKENLIVLFSSYNEGVVVYALDAPIQGRFSNYEIGYHSRSWNEGTEFKPFYGTVEIVSKL